MAKLTQVFNKKTALDILYIGGGAVAGTYAGTQVYTMLKGDPADTTKTPFDADEKLKPYIKGGVPILVGAFLPSLLGRSEAVKGIGNGMIASGASLIVAELLKKAGMEIPVQGVGNVMMQGVGNVMMQGYNSIGPDRDMGNGVALGAAYDNYSDTSYDTTPAAAGEMDY
tara:strand:+ start:10608 stop:11114 length:507 start_codon:yes stop_codon:yes gene_type:complete